MRITNITVTGWWLVPVLVAIGVAVTLLIECVILPRTRKRKRTADREWLFCSIVEQAGNAHDVRSAIRVHMSYDSAWRDASEEEKADAVAEAIAYYRERRLTGGE